MANADHQRLAPAGKGDPIPYLRLELSEPVLLRLLSEGALCAAEFRSLDTASHRLVRKLVLQSCIERLKRARTDPFSFHPPKGGTHERHRP